MSVAKPFLMVAVFVVAVCRASAEEDAPRLLPAAADRAAILQAVDSYVAEFNRGDAKAVAEHWCATGEWVSPAGRRIQGKAAIGEEMETLFREQSGVTIEVANPSVRFVSPEVAIEEGVVHVVRPNAVSSDATYIAIHVKRDGEWKLDSVRETNLPEPAPANAELAELEWLIGSWIDRSDDAAVEATVAWTKNKKFMNWSFKASAPGMDDLEGTQVIGWDPAAGTIRSWMFDSDGGFGAGTWTRKENQWLVDFSQVLTDGRSASATNIYTLLDENTYTWQSTDRQADGEPLPNIEEVTVVRQAADEVTATTRRPRATESDE